MRESFFPGKETWYASDSPTGPFATVFQDDGDTGYYYAHDLADGGRILDALHIYNVPAVVDRDQASFAEIVWSPDSLKAALLINEHPHAVIDFAERRSYCRTGFPSPPPDWNRGLWREDLLELFRRR